MRKRKITLTMKVCSTKQRRRDCGNNTLISPLLCKIFVAEQWAYTLKKWRAQEDWGPSPGGPRKPFQKRFLHEQKELLCGIDGYWQFKVRLKDAVTFCLFSVSKSMFDCIAVHWMSMGVELPSFHSDPPEEDLKLSSIQWTSMILSFNQALQNFRYFITMLFWWISAALSWMSICLIGNRTEVIQCPFTQLWRWMTSPILISHFWAA